MSEQAYAGLLERLEEEALSKAGSSIDRGCVDCGLSANLCNEAAEAISSLLKRVGELEGAGQNIIDRMFGTYRAGNGRQVSIEGDDGEKCWIVHSDDIEQLRAALNSDAPLSIGEEQ